MENRMIPREYQEEQAKAAYATLEKYMMVYLAWEERTGKSLTAVLIAEMCKSVKSVLIVTKKNAIGNVEEEKGWLNVLDKFDHEKFYTVTNYHQVHKQERHDLVILDESHNYISGYPKQPGINKKLVPLTRDVPIIYLSATPHAQGYQMLFHQFYLSTWSPWASYKNFYSWFKVYGIPNSIYVHGKSLNVYTETKESLVKSCIDHLFNTKTRKELNFTHEPVDKKHYLELSTKTRDIYNALIQDRIVELDCTTIIADTPMKLRTSLHQLEGGVAKMDSDYFVLANMEKIKYIKDTWGDVDNIAIFYNYIAEGTKLRKYFKNAMILQATSNAEGIDLAHIETIVIYSQDFSSARHTQRRARQAAKNRDSDIVVHYLLVKDAVSDQVYNTVSINKTNFVDSVFDKTTI